MKRALILGDSRSGRASYNLLKNQYQIDFYDDKYKDHIKLKRKLYKELPLYDLCVRSPGFKRTNNVYRLAQLLSKEVISELELGFRFLKSKKIITITGTNGKTTLGTILYELLKEKNNVHFLSNNGIPLSEKVLEIKKDDIVIIEASSFQLEDIKYYHSLFSVITSLSPNHLNAVENTAIYYASKKKLLINSKYILDLSNKFIDCNKEKDIINKIKIKRYDNLQYEYYLKTAIYILNKLNYKYSIKIKKLMPLDYRNQIIHDNNPLIINDSKSTSQASTKMSILKYKDKKCLLLIGGIFKSSSFSFLCKYPNITTVCFGKDKDRLVKQTKGIAINSFFDIKEYLKIHKNLYEVIVFSPGCSSFDEFTSYKERGLAFTKMVREIWK